VGYPALPLPWLYTTPGRRCRLKASYNTRMLSTLAGACRARRHRVNLSKGQKAAAPHARAAPSHAPANGQLRPTRAAHSF